MHNSAILRLACGVAIVAFLQACPVQAAATPGQLKIEFTTTPVAGKFSPKHVLAVWVTDAQTNFVRTLELRATRRARYLSAWQAARKDEVSVDGVTGATVTQHQTHQVAWDSKNLKGEVVPNGTYLVFLELTSQHAPGAVAVFPILKGPAVQTKQFPKRDGCEKATLTFVPDSK